MSVLLLADRWKMMPIRVLAVAELSKFKLDPIEKILIAKKYQLGVPWARDAYARLVGREEPPNVEEAQKIGASEKETEMLSLQNTVKNLEIEVANLEQGKVQAEDERAEAQKMLETLQEEREAMHTLEANLSEASAEISTKEQEILEISTKLATVRLG